MQFENESKASIQNTRGWRDFLELKKEIFNMDEKFFLSSDNVAANHSYDIGRSGMYKKSESLDAHHSPNNLDSFIDKGIKSRKLFNDRRCKIKSSKDLRKKKFDVRNHGSKSKTNNRK